MKVASHSSG